MRYVVEVAEEDEDEDEDGWGESEFATVYRINDDGTKTEVGWIGGEPEDNTYYRRYSWIVGALNDAYELGIEKGQEQTDDFSSLDWDNHHESYYGEL